MRPEMRETKKTRRRSTKSKMFVAVVVRVDGQPSLTGKWSAFTGEDLDSTIAKAKEKMAEWHLAGNGPYEILVGEIVGRVVFPVKYDVVPL